MSVNINKRAFAILIVLLLVILTASITYIMVRPSRDEHLKATYKETFAKLQTIQPFNKMKDDSPTTLQCFYEDAAGHPAPKRCSKVTSEQVLPFSFKDESDFNTEASHLETTFLDAGWKSGEGYIRKTFCTPAGGGRWDYIMAYTKGDCNVRLTANQEKSNQIIASYACSY